MLGKSCLLLIFVIIHTNYVFGEIKYQSVLTTWKSGVEKMLTDKLELEISKLKEKIEERFEKLSEKNLDEKIAGKLEELLENKLEEKFEAKFGKKHNESQAEIVEWIPAHFEDLNSLSGRAVVAGTKNDGGPIWVMRAPFGGDLIPGKLIVNQQWGFVSFGSREHHVKDGIEVCCAPPEKVRWVESSNGDVPPHAIVAGVTSEGQKLYVGRAEENGILIPGKVNPSKKEMSIAYFDEEIFHNTYEVLCIVV